MVTSRTRRLVRTEQTQRGYRDLREHLAALEEAGLLIRVRRPINKDTEMHPLVRWQYRGGIPEDQRKAFLFENVVDVKGRTYPFSVLLGGLAASPQVVSIGLQCPLASMDELWKRAMTHPIDPVLVETGPVHEEVHIGDELDREGLGLDEIPVPISTPGFDNGPYTSASHWITKDPETGIRNIGNYRGQVKARRRLGMFPSFLTQHIYLHWDKARKLGQPLPAAVVIGCPPAISYASVQKIPYGMDELAVAGGLVGEPIRVVKCKTIDLEVPAEAELVIEGYLNTEELEPEGPFGESHGYMHPRGLSPFLDVTAITHRRDMIHTAFISQVTPSESSVIKKIGYDALFLHHLRDVLSLKTVKRVHMHEPLTNLRKFIIIQMDHPSEPEVWRALHAAATFHPGVGKFVVAVDMDIAPENLDAVMWAICYRSKPDRDVHIISGLEKGHSPPFSSHGLIAGKPDFYGRGEDAALLINAVLKEPYPPISLPKREFMERAKEIWEELGLPALRPESPWYGYSLGDWDDEMEEEAALALQGEHYRIGEKLATRRVKATGEEPSAGGDGQHM